MHYSNPDFGIQTKCFDINKSFVLIDKKLKETEILIKEYQKLRRTIIKYYRYKTEIKKSEIDTLPLAKFIEIIKNEMGK